MNDIGDFAEKLMDTMHVIARTFSNSHSNELCMGKITFPQFMVLEFLSRHSMSKMTDIARHMNITTAAITGQVDRLQKNGYVERVNDQKDRRIINIRLLQKGSRLVSRIQGQRRDIIVSLFEKISDRDREEYLRILAKIRDAAMGKKHE